MWKWQNINLHRRHKKDLWSLVVLCSEMSAQLESLSLSGGLFIYILRIFEVLQITGFIMSLRSETYTAEIQKHLKAGLCADTGPVTQN